MPERPSVPTHLAGVMPRPSRPWGLVVALVLGALAVGNVANALHKGGDFDVFVEGGRRVLEAEPLYRDSSPGQGVIGPPFQAVFFVPAAWLSERHGAAAKLVWHVVGLLALAAGVWYWARALPLASVVDGGAPWQSPAVLLALLAIALPAQTNFEHQNLNTVLLGATGAGAYALVRGRDALGGGLIGLAAALKAFPALLLIHLACAGKWKATSVGVATAAFLTALPIAWYGVDGGLAALGDWLRLNQEGGWPTRFQNQSLFAAAARLSQEAAMPVLFLGAAVLVGLTAWVASTRVGRTTGLAGGLALALAVAVLVSPIAWDHYWVLLFPTFLWVAGDAMRGGDDGRRGSWLTFGAAALLVSGLSPVFGAGVFNAARAFSSYTLAGLLLVGWSVSALIGGHSSNRER